MATRGISIENAMGASEGILIMAKDSKRYLGTFKPGVATELRAFFEARYIKAIFRRRGDGANSCFAVFSSDPRAVGVLREYAEQKRRAAQMPLPFASPTGARDDSRGKV